MIKATSRSIILPIKPLGKLSGVILQRSKEAKKQRSKEAKNSELLRVKIKTAIKKG
ncbi:hypothetical protein [Shewanella sp. 6_MG-2023]|uniref:hypothetical protein n=1 Tax=Shewanella sp. 6_MG-2023 TaxID=3062660 RepID=UPI0026E3B4B9|nr:hypothetical protein [Shewanella sp. 6_MG-2023]MDO6618803.1 hypothetical protein [Shewanella sp. 6_MG-2023]